MSKFSFNEEQREEMDRLAAIPPDQLAWCGWYRLGDCSDYHMGECAERKSAADKMKVWCPHCRSVPSNGKTVHTIGCVARGEQ